MRIIDGRQVKAARAILGMTVREMAEAAGINKNSVLFVERHQGIRSAWGGPYSLRQLSKAIAERGIVCDVVDGEPIVRFATTPPPPKYRRKEPASGC